MTPFHLAIKKDSDQILTLFLKAGVDENQLTMDGMTAIQLAVTTGQPDVVQRLLNAGIGRVDNAAMYLANPKNAKDFALTEAQRKVKLNIKFQGKTALLLAAEQMNQRQGRLFQK